MKTIISYTWLAISWWFRHVAKNLKKAFAPSFRLIGLLMVPVMIWYVTVTVLNPQNFVQFVRDMHSLTISANELFSEQNQSF